VEVTVKLRSLTNRRPSPALVISSAALFLSMGGVGAAATGLIGTNQIKNGAVTYNKIAPNSVGKVRLANGGVVNSKLANGSVSYKDIQPGAVGTVRANTNQLQARVKGTCPAGSAVATVSNKGAVTCNTTAPEEYGTATTAAPVTLTGTSATTGTVTLPTPGTFLALADTQLTATSGATAQRVTVSCTQTVGSTTETRTATLLTDGTTGDTTTASLPQQLPGAGGASTIACTATLPTGSGTLPTVTATSAINALQTSANN
jgi:hypothetical protein